LTPHQSDLLEREDLLALVEVTRDLASEVHLPRLLHRILEDATRLTDSPDGSVILHDEKRGSLYFADAIGGHAEQLLRQWGKTSEQSVPVIGSNAGQVFTSGNSIIVDAVAEDPNHFKGVDRESRRLTARMVCVPLIVTSWRTEQRKTIGVIQILNKRSGNYTARDKVLLERFADQAAVALDNAQLVSDLFAHMGLYGRDGAADPVRAYREIRSTPAWHETLSLMFADMRGFTQFCQVVGRPEIAQSSLNEFLTLLADAVMAHDGIVNKFLGDGLLAIFRGENHAANAVECGFAMLEAFDVMKARWDERSNSRMDFLDLGIGISTGDVILGSVGSERVWDFTAIGTEVNLAAYLMEHARDGRRLLVDKVTFKTTQHLVEAFEGPERFELNKPGQTVRHPYERYCLARKRGEAAGAGGPTPQEAQASGGAIFVSYSHADERWLKLFQKHLKPYIRAGSLDLWDDTRIKVGDQWRSSIEKALGRAKVALLLVSPNFLESEFIAKNELPPLLQASRSRGVRIVWVPLSASSFDETPIADFQAALNPATPLDTMTEPQQNQVLVTVCKAIKAAL
jgi:adenylate cyclase